MTTKYYLFGDKRFCTIAVIADNDKDVNIAFHCTDTTGLSVKNKNSINSLLPKIGCHFKLIKKNYRYYMISTEDKNLKFTVECDCNVILPKKTITKYGGVSNGKNRI